MLYNSRAADGTLMATLNELASTKSKGTQSTMQVFKNLMEYCHSHIDVTIRYCASQMQLHINSDASYLSASKARSRVRGHFFLNEKINPMAQTKHNGAVLVVTAILKNVMASAAEAELRGLLIKAKEGEVLRNSLEEMGHQQGPAHMKTDNSTASGIINETVKQRRYKAMDMRFYCVRDRCKQKHFLSYWAPGKYNMGDYYTKFHSPFHHKKQRQLHVHNETSPQYIPYDTSTLQQGCVKLFPRRKLT